MSLNTSPSSALPFHPSYIHDVQLSMSSVIENPLYFAEVTDGSFIEHQREVVLQDIELSRNQIFYVLGKYLGKFVRGLWNGTNLSEDEIENMPSITDLPETRALHVIKKIRFDEDIHKCEANAQEIFKSISRCNMGRNLLGKFKFGELKFKCVPRHEAPSKTLRRKDGGLLISFADVNIAIYLIHEMLIIKTFSHIDTMLLTKCDYTKKSYIKGMLKYFYKTLLLAHTMGRTCLKESPVASSEHRFVTWQTDLSFKDYKNFIRRIGILPLYSKDWDKECGNRTTEKKILKVDIQ